MQDRACRPGATTTTDTLYRALFSFIDPLIRAELLVADVLEPADDLGALPATPQDLSTGITYHFMHPIVRSRALGELFTVPPLRAAAGTPSRIRAVARARTRSTTSGRSARAPIRFAIDASRAEVVAADPAASRTARRTTPGLAGRPDLLALHRDMNRQLALQTEQWDSYDYGEGYFYQSSDELGVTGLRDTAGAWSTRSA